MGFLSLYCSLINSLTTWGCVIKIKKMWVQGLENDFSKGGQLCPQHSLSVAHNYLQFQLQGIWWHFQDSVGIYMFMAHRNSSRKACIPITLQILIKKRMKCEFLSKTWIQNERKWAPGLKASSVQLVKYRDDMEKDCVLLLDWDMNHHIKIN